MKRNAMSIRKSTRNAEANEKNDPNNAATERTLCRPHVSVKKPQKYDVETIPKYEMAAKTPCSDGVSFKSHLAYGIT